MRPSGERKFVKKLWKSRRGSLDELELAALSGSTNRTRTSRVDEVLRAPRRIRGAESRQGVDANPREDLRLTISGGEQKGRKLRTPDAYIRPMMAQVRQAMFSMLGELTELGPSTSMLDLFSGSGCVGLEALSRGCQTVASVDFSAKCADVMRYNARACGYEDRHTTVCAKAEDVLADPARFKLRYPFDLITLTPPYEEVPRGRGQRAARPFARSSAPHPERSVAPQRRAECPRCARRAQHSPRLAPARAASARVDAPPLDFVC